MASANSNPHAWEVGDDASAAHGGRPRGRADYDQTSDAEPDPETNCEAAAMRFSGIFVEMLTPSAIFARARCVLRYWAWRASTPSLAKTHAHAPGKQTGRHEEHLGGLLSPNVPRQT